MVPALLVTKIVDRWQLPLILNCFLRYAWFNQYIALTKQLVCTILKRIHWCFVIITKKNRELCVFGLLWVVPVIQAGQILVYYHRICRTSSILCSYISCEREIYHSTIWFFWGITRVFVDYLEFLIFSHFYVNCGSLSLFSERVLVIKSV